VSGNLTLLDSEQSDVGRYKCVASNGISSVTATVELYVALPPDTGTGLHYTLELMCYGQSRAERQDILSVFDDISRKSKNYLCDTFSSVFVVVL